MTKPDWNALTHVEKIDFLRPLVEEGYTCTLMASMFVNATANAVMGFIWRYQLRHSDKVVARVRAQWDGETYTKSRQVRTKKRRSVVDVATDPRTRRVIDAYNKPHPFPRTAILKEAGIYSSLLVRWRRGERVASPFEEQCMMEAIQKLEEHYGRRS